MTSIVDVTQSNFSKEFPNICRSIDNCTFYSFDCEFTGLKNENFSLFDSPKERYHKVKENIKGYFIPQFGLSTFTHVRGTNTFESATYNFYLMPYSTKTFQCELSNIEFLSSYGFNWQTLFTEGLQYLSWADEKRIMAQLEADTLWFDILSDLPFHYSDILKLIIGKVSLWHKSGIEEDLCIDVPSNSPHFFYLLCRVIPQRFHNLKTSRMDYNQIKVTRTSVDSKLDEKFRPDDIVQEYFLGFSKVWKMLVASKKPMVGHNIFMDLAMMFQQFLGPLPGSYGSFKLALHRVFPVVFDTKHICFELRKMVPREREWPTNSLEELFNFFRTDQFLSTVLLQPTVKTVPEGNFHNAGFDAFCSGFCFIRFSYLLSISSKPMGKFLYPMIPRTCTELLAAISVYANTINVIRCQVNCISLDGQDPTGRRPDILLVESKNDVDLLKLKDILTCYSCVDLRVLSRNRVLLAIGSFSAAREIEESLRSDTISITRYNRFLHNRKFMLAGIASVGLVITLYTLMRLR